MIDAAAIVAAYAIGSVPFAFLVARRVGVDVRRFGSGNVGAANVYRTTRASLGLAAFGLDFLKGATAVLTAAGLGCEVGVQAVSGVSAVVGHIWPMWLRFRGGKGVATASGAFLILAPAPTTVGAVIFLAIVGVSRYISLGSIAASLSLPVLTYVFDEPWAVTAAAALAAALIVSKHRSNIRRLTMGTERRLGASGMHPPGARRFS